MKNGLHPKEAYSQLVTLLRELARLEESLKLLEWDQATYMPSGAEEERAEQMAALAEIIHEKRTDPRFLELVDELATRTHDLEPGESVDVRETKWRLDRLRKVPRELQAARANAQARARAAWGKAKEQSRFEILAPHLAEVLKLEREYAQVLSNEAPYQALLEEYEPGVSEHLLQRLFEELRQPLLRLAAALAELQKRKRRRPSVLRGSFPIPAQRMFNRFIAEQLGFDFRRGRMDESAHPFSISIGRDYRITTRYDEGDLRVGLFSTLHELGHALYEQGLDPQAHGLPRGSACSLGVHESQSRLWENFVGRSEAFWRFLLPHGSRLVPGLKGATLDAVLVDVNEAGPTPVRTEADELTYNLHVLLRWELERALIAGELEVNDLPGAWNQGMKNLLGIVPSSDREGVLQDIHWPSGAFGYFPTYTLGNIYAAQIMEAAEERVGPLSPQIERGVFSALKEWLQHEIYCRGQEFHSPELVEQVTGQPPTVQPLLKHLHHRFSWWCSHGVS
ncbi:MAG: carboxypeptidase M32 [Candidatus Binatia bacterium]|nr:carboxypeptidase M32 [Candidatus Binatia bacterium]